MLRDQGSSQHERCAVWSAAPEFPDGTAGDSRLTGYQRLKERLDFWAALTLLILTGPLILVADAVVKLTSRGPAFYTQRRSGQNGRPYTIFKIRTMIHNCE